MLLVIDTERGRSMEWIELELRPVRLHKPFLPGEGKSQESLLFLLQTGRLLRAYVSMSLSCL